MDITEMISRLRSEGGFRLLPLLSHTGEVAGIHLTRFAAGGFVDVMQVWQEGWTSFARVRDSLDLAAPLGVPPTERKVADDFAVIANALLLGELPPTTLPIVP